MVTRFSWCTALVALLAVAGITGLPVMPSAMAQDAEQQAEECPDCSAALDGSGWCAKCNAGFAKGVKTKCRSCLTAIQGNGWCDDCKVGYVGGKKTGCKNCFAAMSAAGGGWCSDCKVGYAKGLKTKCEKCFAAIKANGTCADCGVRFQDGRSFKRFALHVHGLDSDAAVIAVRTILGKQKGVASLDVNRETGKASFELETSGNSIAAVIDVLKAGGYTAHEGDD